MRARLAGRAPRAAIDLRLRLRLHLCEQADARFDRLAGRAFGIRAKSDLRLRDNALAARAAASGAAASGAAGAEAAAASMPLAKLATDERRGCQWCRPACEAATGLMSALCRSDSEEEEEEEEADDDDEEEEGEEEQAAGAEMSSCSSLQSTTS